MSTEKLVKYNYQGEDLFVFKEEYAHGGTALILKCYDEEFGYLEVYSVVSVFIENFSEVLPSDCVCIKNYSENAGILDWLISNGIVSEPIMEFPYNFVDIPVCRILV